MAHRRTFVPDFRPHKLGLSQVLGELESEVMETIWARGETTVRDVHSCLLSEREIAYTTVMTVMSRLSEKGLLLREADGNSYIYRPAVTRQVFVAQAVGEVLDALLTSHAPQTVSHFAASLDKVSAEEIRQLEELIKKRKGG